MMELYPTQQVAARGYKVFDPSVSKLVYQSSFFDSATQSSSTATQNFIKLCRYTGQNV